MNKTETKEEEQIVVIGVIAATVECDKCGGLTALSGNKIIYNFCGCVKGVPIKLPKISGRVAHIMNTILSDVCDQPNNFLYHDDDPLTEQQQNDLYSFCELLKEQFLKLDWNKNENR